ncbi:U3 small nucleolar RNA-associated protein 18 homolog [Manduca sexta]|uniref:U3 small nucleolar RNA-associated protein 18 homolog n=1 Tax=Manduca sexta TaxID=7130 RepID=UPI00188EC1E4|nr:U3 small nucleolar RNA-associated protein 18 homolog [Manduca sexta]
MKRKLSKLDENEARLSQLLFSKTENFAQKLKVNTTSVSEHEDQELDKKPAWIDDDDENFGANIIPNVKSKAFYKEKLQQKYSTLVGTPNWAKLNKKIKKDDESDDQILRTVGHLHKKKSENLPKDFLELKNFPRLNAQTKNEGPNITCIEFHPTMSVSLVAGQSGVVSLFSIGGDVNNKLHSFKLKNWKISAAHFSPDGSEAYIASKNNHSYCIYDLVKAESKLVQLPQISKRPNIFVLSPNGKYLATSDCLDEVYLICAASKELLRILKHNTNVTSVIFSHDSKSLYSYGCQGEVTMWDLSTYRPLRKFYDNGCVTASCIQISPCGRLLATGSGEGIVNVYQTSNLNTSEPLPLKTISNLTTKITNLRFNASSEILSATSSFYPNAVKLIHIPSYHVFANFPIHTQNYHQVETVNFSPNSGYMAMGNNKGYAYLFRLKYYKNY